MTTADAVVKSEGGGEVKAEEQVAVKEADGGVGEYDDEGHSGRWTKEEDEALKLAVKNIGPHHWKRIASEYLSDRRSDVQCLHRWQKVLRPGLVKGPWTPEEDETIKECMRIGITRWSEIAKRVPGRIGKQCRERWFNHLDPDINREEWTAEEDQKLIEGQAALGNKWSQIAKLYLPGRPENAVKNRWNAATRRRRSGTTPSSTPKGRPPAKGIDRVSSTNNKRSPKSGAVPKTKKKTSEGKRGAFVGGNARLANMTELELKGMASLASLCAALKPASTATPTAQGLMASNARLQTLLSANRSDTMKRSLDALSGAAALLAAAGELASSNNNNKIDQPQRKKQRGSSFAAARPTLQAPSVTISSLQAPAIASNVNGSATIPNMVTPIWNNKKPGTSSLAATLASSISPAERAGLSAAVSLASLTNKQVLEKTSTAAAAATAGQTTNMNAIKRLAELVSNPSS